MKPEEAESYTDFTEAEEKFRNATAEEKIVMIAEGDIGTYGDHMHPLVQQTLAQAIIALRDYLARTAKAG